MAQNYTEQLRKDNVRDAIYEDLQNNCEVLRTSWSGNAFPANPKVGQPCYRVDEDKLYYWDGYKWSQKGGGGSAELKTMELAAATSERVSITLEGARCLDKNMMFVFVDKIAQDPSTYSMNDDGTVVNFNPAIPANAAVTLRWFDTDVGTFDTAIFASDAEFAAGELTNRAPNVKQVHSLSDMVASKLSGLELMDVGFAPLGIDESENKRRYLNGQVISQSQFPAFTAAVKARMTTMANAFTTEENWQAEKTNSKLGQCGKFVVDDTAGTIRLPAVVNAQGLADLSLIGGIKSESLPNITGKWPTGRNIPFINNTSLNCGCFSVMKSETPLNHVVGIDTNYQGLPLSFDASGSSSTYQDNAPVQQEAVQYPYYIQVATGVEETLPAIREYNINTPFFFGQSMYSDVAPDNASWLASNGQWNAKTVYPDYYDWLVEQMNAGVSGFVSSTDTYTDYDYVINTADQTFRLPVLSNRILVEKKEPTDSDSTWYNLYSDGWLEQGGVLETSQSTTVTFVKPYITTPNVMATAKSISTTSVAASVMTTAITLASFSVTSGGWRNDGIFTSAGGSVPKVWSAQGYTNIPQNTTWKLYYYVGDTVQDASLINAGAVLGQLATKTNSVEAAAASMPSNRYIDLTLGASGTTYTAPANGWFSIQVEVSGNNLFFGSVVSGDYGFVIPIWTGGGIIPVRVIVPCTAGRIFKTHYNCTINAVTEFRFIYAQSEQ